MTTPENRIDALRKAIDLAVSDLNEAWGGFGPNEQLERIIGALQRARTADDIAQGRDWPPVVLTARPTLDVETLRFAKAITEYGVHHGNCPYNSWNKSMTRCKCGLFRLIKDAAAILAAKDRIPTAAQAEAEAALAEYRAAHAEGADR